MNEFSNCCQDKSPRTENISTGLWDWDVKQEKCLCRSLMNVGILDNFVQEGLGSGSLTKIFNERLSTLHNTVQIAQKACSTFNWSTTAQLSFLSNLCAQRLAWQHMQTIAAICGSDISLQASIDLSCSSQNKTQVQVVLVSYIDRTSFHTLHWWCSLTHVKTHWTRDFHLFSSPMPDAGTPRALESPVVSKTFCPNQAVFQQIVPKIGLF